MELMYAVVLSFFLALAVRYIVPGRDMLGFVLLPAIGTVVGSAVWVVLTWLGWGPDNGWLWVISLAAAILAPLPFALLLPGRRRRADETLLAELLNC